jgi:preprotein translocase subunit YajC
MSLFGISSAYAQTPGAAASAGPMDMLQSIAPLILIFGIFYFLMIRPQQQRAKQHKAALAQLRRGDTVVTAGGIIGTVSRVVNDEEITVDIAEGVRVRVVRSTITGLTAKGEPRTDSKPAANDTQDEEPPAVKPATTRRRKTTGTSDNGSNS